MVCVMSGRHKIKIGLCGSGTRSRVHGHGGHSVEAEASVAPTCIARGSSHTNHSARSDGMRPRSHEAYNS
jgi:hypothetical protein